MTAGTVGTSRRTTGGGGYSGAPCGPLQHKQGRVPGRGRRPAAGAGGAPGACGRGTLSPEHVGGAAGPRYARVGGAARLRFPLTQRLGSRPECVPRGEGRRAGGTPRGLARFGGLGLNVCAGCASCAATGGGASSKAASFLLRPMQHAGAKVWMSTRRGGAAGGWGRRDDGASGCWRRARAATCAVVHDANVAHITSIAQYDNEEFHAER